jgi:hypothetical protein
MNYYDMLLQHQQRLADAEKQHQQDRHLRDLKRARKQQQAEENEQPSTIARVMVELKAAFSARKNQLEQDTTSDICPQPGIRVNL